MAKEPVAIGPVWHGQSSEIHFKDWHPNIGDHTLSDAICDRLLQNAYKIEMRGDSMRRSSH